MLLKESYGNSEKADYKYQKKAYSAWAHYFQHNNGKTSEVEGVLGCYCNEKYDVYGFDAAYQLVRKDGGDDPDNDDTEVEENQICYYYVMEDKL